MHMSEMRGNESPEAIEARIEADRARLRSAIAGLRARVQPSALAEEAVGLLRANAQVPLRLVDGAVRRNPMAAATIATGLAWLAVGSMRPSRLRPSPALSGRADALIRWEDEGGSPAPEPELDALGGDDWMREAETLYSRAVGVLARIDRSARLKLSAPAETAAARARVLGELASGLSGAMGRGLSSLSSEARQKALAAREAAWSARLQAGAVAGGAIERHPWLSGAVALTLGAGLAALLPRTEAEERLVGNESARLKREAARLLADERERATALARQAAEDVLAGLRSGPDNGGETPSV